MKHTTRTNGSSDSSSPLVSAVVAKLVEMIRSEELPGGRGLPSERRLSFELNVSRNVVRSAIHELARIGLVDSRPNCRPVVKLARPNELSGKQQIGIWLWPNTADHGAAMILKGIQSAGFEHDVRLIVAHASGRDWGSCLESEARFLRSLHQDSSRAGAILWYVGHERNRNALQEARSAGVETVFIDRLPPEGFEADYVGTNNKSAAAAGVAHLLKLGHRRIAFLTNIDRASSVRERLCGYRLALDRERIPADPQLIQQVQVDESVGIECALEVLLHLAEPPTAIFCVNDHLALQAYEALERRGIQIPDEISLLGFDGVLRWVPGGGHLTTLAQDFERIGQLAAELVIERMTSGEPQAYRHVLLDAPLFDCGSTSAPPTTHSSIQLSPIGRFNDDYS